MTEEAFLDTNVPMYALGQESPARESAVAIMRAVTIAPQNVWTSAEVLQELYHLSLRRGDPNRGSAAIRLITESLGARVAPLEAADILWCLGKQLPSQLQARDRVHLAVMDRIGVTRIISADRGFDAVPGITRLDPLDFEQWRSLVFDA